MNTRILIIEDKYVEALELKLLLTKAGYLVCTLPQSVREGLVIIEDEKPDLVLLDIQVKADINAIDIARILLEKNIAFVYLYSHPNKQILDAAKATKPHGLLVKPLREKDVLLMLELACYSRCQDQGKIPDAKHLPIGLPEQPFKEMIGASECMQDIMEQVKRAAGSDIAVLVLGESGTGKELIAQSIHRISSRKQKPFIALNCAALPVNLVESELFGHEKGAFTGASEKRIGIFEQANEGTVFLDEIGDLPLDLQVKLLRVLQEMEITPIGGKTKKVNIRIIAATNRNLEEEVSLHRFRLDLYYRLNIFPISVPALRERKEDIATLARHFVHIYARKENKPITGLADHVLKSMLNYDWPGNIRELENFIARTVVLTDGPIVNTMKLPDQNKNIKATAVSRVKTMIENERDHILAALSSCNWKIHGRGGAADLLELNPSTLNSRIKKLGIEKTYLKTGMG